MGLKSVRLARPGLGKPKESASFPVHRLIVVDRMACLVRRSRDQVVHLRLMLEHHERHEVATWFEIGARPNQPRQVGPIRTRLRIDWASRIVACDRVTAMPHLPVP